jgi:P27 family predicted phage terminase small subunit
MRGRKPKATAIKEAEGAFVKDPQRRNHQEPKLPMKAPRRPESLKGDKVAQSMWRWLVKNLSEMRVITEADQQLMESYCLTYSRIMEDEFALRKEGNVIETERGPKRNPRAINLVSNRSAQLKMLAELGLTPSARTRLKATPEEETDVFAELMKRRESLN